MDSCTLHTPYQTSKHQSISQSIWAHVPSTKSQRGAIVETHRSPRCGRHDPSYHKTHTFTSSGKVASKWPRSWTGRNNHHFTGTLVKALSPLLEENLTPSYSLLPFFFCTDEGKMGESAMLLYFHSKNLLFAKHRLILTAYSFTVFIAIVVSF